MNALPKAMTFHERVREHLQTKQLSIAELAERAELAPSLISKLLTDTDDARREPRLEHILAIARALEVALVEVVGGTAAESVLTSWVPRTEFEAESGARIGAQTESATLRTKLAGRTAEIASLREAIERLSRLRANSEDEARREHTQLRARAESAEARLRSAVAECDQALAAANQNYRAWASACSQYHLLQRHVEETKVSAGLVALIGTIGGALFGAAAAESARPTPVTRRAHGRRPRRQHA